MSAIAALHSNSGCTNGCPASVGDDTRNNNKLTNEVALEISQHLGDFVTVDLNLEIRHNVPILEMKAEIVSLVNLLNSFFKLEN
jgi:hypothetical protein